MDFKKLIPDSVAVVADKNHSMYNRLGWVDEVGMDPETGDCWRNWVSIEGGEYDMPDFAQVIPLDEAIKGRIGSLISGVDLHLAVGKQVYDKVAEGEGSLFQVRPELEGLTNDQLKTLAEAALDIFMGA